jgi:hypothetical protein
MKHATRLACSAAAFLCLGAVPSAGTAQPPERADNGVSYISGGVGDDEAYALRQAAADYPLTLELAAVAPAAGARDPYVSNARIDVLDQSGNPIVSTSGGPLMLLKVPSGRYTVAVVWHGTQKQQTVDVGANSHEHVMFEFPAEAGSQ